MIINLRLVFTSCFLIFVSFILYNIYIIDPHIHGKLKFNHYLAKVFFYCVGIGGNFNRYLFNQFMNNNLYFSKPKATDNKFIDGVLIEDVDILSLWSEELHKNVTIKAQIFYPESYNTDKLPVLLHIHGGGFVLDALIDRSFEFCKLGLIVVSLDYRLAPEYKFPTAVEDAYSALSFIYSKSHKLLEKVDLDKVVILGDSAGGNLSAVLALLSRDRNSGFEPRIAHQILIYPTMNIRHMTDSNEKFKDGYILSKHLMDWFHDQYLDKDENYNNPLANPLKAESLRNLPPALIILATDDILYDDGIEYGNALKREDVKVEFKEYVSVHGFFNILGLNAEEIEAFNHISDYLRRNAIIQ